ncbi:hypothetical protein HZA39_03325 [Candidatus Peregrinibacteria bacterium]|nr:hypothetical protein [Candidatus Peregrinibacteria bacterium]
MESVAIAGKQYVNVWLNNKTTACMDMEYKFYKLPDGRDAGFVIKLTEEEKQELGIDKKINAGRVGTTDLIYMDLDTETEINVDPAKEDGFEQSREIEKLLEKEPESEFGNTSGKTGAVDNAVKTAIIERLKQM